LLRKWIFRSNDRIKQGTKMNEKVFTNKSGDTVIFNEENHTYTLKKTNEQLESCTRFLNKFFPKFDKEFWLAYSAKEEGISEEELEKEWEHRKKVACDLGSNVHKFAELYLRFEEITSPKNDTEKKLFDLVKIKIDNLKKEWILIDTEKILFSKKLSIAGTTDIIMKNRKTRSLGVFDWKTNENLFLNNPREKALEPISHLDSCELTKYSLQLNIYQRLILEEKYYKEYSGIEMQLFHVKPDSVSTIHVSDMQKEVDDMLNYDRDKLIDSMTISKSESRRLRFQTGGLSKNDILKLKNMHRKRAEE
jgi:hypothetical protein